MGRAGARGAAPEVRGHRPGVAEEDGSVVTTQVGREAVLLSAYVQGRTCGDLVVGSAGGSVHKVNDLVGIG